MRNKKEVFYFVSIPEIVLVYLMTITLKLEKKYINRKCLYASSLDALKKKKLHGFKREQTKKQNTNKTSDIHILFTQGLLESF